ncbi:hypothetical protein GII33_11715 [Gordonia pseudamarae]|uniref:Uncharacterized protein n=1 Tax=Gordonia pseudamarae TaxID=2831662 RepID=A0ABX6IHS0_9ACTN|nr:MULTISPECIES: hypothetical protein [Gordonia]MBD0021283.1 hypothetical protein [Gordonia sp. (in: high G+C Gram-positive bacteria)]QHN26530.1 hypothetical protein GII33_11715 [Gordonia pseudamarae]QHN35423.1 hypothetical protein GII31_11545 [Gordonia pseudamarae]
MYRDKFCARSGLDDHSVIEYDDPVAASGLGESMRDDQGSVDAGRNQPVRAETPTPRRAAH